MCQKVSSALCWKTAEMYLSNPCPYPSQQCTGLLYQADLIHLGLTPFALWCHA